MTIKKWILSAILGLSTQALFGCAGFPVNKSDSVNFEKTSSDLVSVGYVQIFQKGDAALIMGNLSLMNPGVSRTLGYISYEVVSNGRTIAEGTASLFPRTLRKFGQARFEARLDSMPPDGAVVKIVYHD